MKSVNKLGITANFLNLIRIIYEKPMVNIILNEKRRKASHLNQERGNSLTVQWLGLQAFTAEGQSSNPGWGTKILQAAQHDQKIFKIK